MSLISVVRQVKLVRLKGPRHVAVGHSLHTIPNGKGFEHALAYHLAVKEPQNALTRGLLKGVLPKQKVVWE